ISVLVVLLLGAFAGWLNGIVITRCKQLPLIVTLGTFSLFRGIAEGLTGGVRNFTGFPDSFLFLGQGRLTGLIPVQLFILLPAAIAFWILLHRSVIGRSLSAIGYSAAGARHAGLPVQTHLRLIYTISGLTASLAAIVYVSRLGQAKSDAGTGYELMAIAAVVLGGTSIRGGRGSISGTLLALAAIIVLQNGLRLSALPAELAGIFTGVVLLTAIGLDSRRVQFARGIASGAGEKRSAVRLLAILGSVLVLAIVTAAATSHFRKQPVAARPEIGMMPKQKGDPYFISCRQGAEEAARELNVQLLWDGPTDLDPAKQNEVVEGWITRGVAAIAVSVENKAAISTVLRKARSRGIKVLAWDADAEPDARDFLINQATPEGIGNTIADQVAQILGGKGSFAVVTSSLSAANQNDWIRFIKKHIAAKYPEIHLVAIQPSEGDRDRAFAEAQTILKVYPDVRAIAAIAAPAVPGVAEAVKQSGRLDVRVTGLSLPNMCKPYVHAGIIRSVVLWDTRNLGYLTVQAAQSLIQGGLRQGSTELNAGRLGRIRVEGDNVMLGLPFVFTKENIDRFNF
ncbi:MAG TPA: substrate-binding domain-containing protein, partial [Bryobacteraceae bacterium]|nr:substrate-binding domain-containing protein [Bryobacteraceae bacterium]